MELGLSKKKGTLQAVEKTRFVSDGSNQGVALAMPKAAAIRHPFRAEGKKT